MEHEPSPYEPPKSSIGAEVQKPLEVIPASKWLRFSNLLIDYVAFMFLAILVGFIVAILFGEEGIRYMESVPDIIIGTPIVLGYYIIFEALSGRTLGKLVTGTKVVNEAGLNASFGQILGRAFSRIIPFEAFSFLGREGRGWHDSIPKTYVVKCR